MKKEILTGKIQGNERGYAFLIRDDGGDDVFISHGELRGAMHGDSVICERTERAGEKPSARVLKITERGITRLVGTYFRRKGGGLVRPDDGRYFTDVFIPFGSGVRVESGDKVLCKIIAYKARQNPVGVITKVLGKQFERGAELASILYSYDLKEEFDKDTLAETQTFRPAGKKDLAAREDFRKTLTFTIDGEDARDFDDAVSIVKEGDCYILGVHIADVSHYVKAGSATDKEAFARGTSVYFPEKVIPMLPERLCNDLCSLVEGKDRLTLSCVMKVDKKGRVKESRITPSVIKSSARLTYTEVQKIFDGDEAARKKRKKLLPALLLMKELAEILIVKREKNGSVDLDVKESAITVGKNGEIEVKPAERDMAHRVIEEFMILANCTVAEYACNLGAPFVYRVHERPAPDKLMSFYAFLEGVGVPVKQKKEEVYPSDFAAILTAAEGSGVFPLVNRVMLRSMQKAVYSAEAKGHFGLAERHYCHFTSPIRRYPDLVVHRILKDIILKGSAGLEEKYAQFVKEAARVSSLKERNADAAERAADDYYKVLYISRFEGESFYGFISGVTNFGLFVELENGVEGLVKTGTLPGSRYFCDRENYTLSDGKRTFRLGERVKITVAGVNLFERRAEFVLAEEKVSAAQKSRREYRREKPRRK